MKPKNRWMILFVSFVANLVVGSAYAWGVLSLPLREMFGFTTAQTGLAFSFALGLIPISMTISGKLGAKIGVSRVILLGGLAAALSFILTSFVTANVFTLYLSYGVLGSIGIGFVYGTAVPNAVKWFPDKRGLAGGIIVGGFGGGAVLFAPIFNAAIYSIGILNTFLYFGIAFGVVVTIASFLIAAPPADYKPAGWSPPPTSAAVCTGGLTPSEMLKTGRFWLLFAIFTFCMVGGIMIIGQAGNISAHRMGAGPTLTATAVLFLGLSNASGRVLWGAISDKIGRNTSLILMFIITAVSLLLLLATNQNTPFPLFVILIMGVGVCFGGFAGTFPAISADNFGTANMGANYGILFFGFGISAFVGPPMAGLIFDTTASHNTAFIIAAILSAIALLFTAFLISSMKKEKKRKEDELIKLAGVDNHAKQSV